MSAGGGRQPRLWFVGHAHIDAVWLWTLEETRRVVRETFRRVLSLMDRYPWLTYVQSSALYYSMAEDMLGEMRRRVEEGRWEPVGGSWVEFDAYMPSAEGLARQLLYGQRYFLERLGRRAAVGWLPDSFGFPNTLPQLLAKAGIRYFYTQKLLWNDTAPHPLHAFRWEAPDGSWVVAYLGHEGYSERLRRDRLGDYLRSSEEFAEREGIYDRLVVYGEGDHGGGPDAEDLEALGAWLPSGAARPGRAEDFFRALEAYPLPTYRGELYLQFHRGVFTTQSRFKALLRRVEVLADVADRLAALAGLLGLGGGRPHVEAWLRVLTYHFHDAISGTCIPEVYEEAERELAEVERGLRAQVEGALRRIEAEVDTRGPGRPVLAFNPLPWPRRALAEVPGLHAVLDADGRPLPSQPTADGGTLFPADLPAMGYRVYWLLEPEGPPPVPDGAAWGRAEGGGAALGNRWLEARVGRSGISLRRGGATVDGVRLRVYEDVPVPGRRTLYGGIDAVIFDAWELYIFQQPGGPRHVDLEAEEVRLLEAGPLRATAEAVMRYRQEGRPDSTFRVRVSVDALSPLVRLAVEADWHAAHRLARLVLPARGEFSVAGVPFGHVVRRGPYSPEATPHDRARYEAPFQGWVHVGGLSVVTHSCRAYGHMEDRLEISLLRAARHPPRWGSPASEWLADRALTDQGPHRLELALLLGEGWREANLPRLAAEEEYRPLVVEASPHGGRLPPAHSFLEVGPENVVVTAVKPAEDGDGLVLRMHEAHGVEAEVWLKASFPIREVYETDIPELEARRLERIALRGHEMKTLKIR